MSDKAEWIKFDLAGDSPSGKTHIWAVVSLDECHMLGNVKWYGAWRKYAFFPHPDTLYEQDCLRAIAKFCEEQTIAHRNKAKHEPLQIA